MDRPTSYPLSRRSLLVAGSALALAPRLAFTQDKYPSRPVEFIGPWGSGGGADQISRQLGQLLEADLKVAFPILNIPGATGNTGMAKLLAAPPDGHSIATFIGAALSLTALIFDIRRLKREGPLTGEDASTWKQLNPSAAL